MGISVEEKGLRNTAVSDVVRIARTSRRSFYEHFADRDACFLALFEATTEEMMRAIRRAVRSRHTWDAQVDAALEAYFASVAARPKLFRRFTRELPALREAGAERQRTAVARFARTLVELPRPDGAGNPGRGAAGPLGAAAAVRGGGGRDAGDAYGGPGPCRRVGRRPRLDQAPSGFESARCEPSR